MVQVFKSTSEMIAHIRHKDVEVKHKAVKVEDIKPVEEPKETPKEEPKEAPKEAKKTTKRTTKKTTKKKEDK